MTSAFIQGFFEGTLAGLTAILCGVAMAHVCLKLRKRGGKNG